MIRREVRVADSFFADLDRQLGDERGADGRPSTTDFLLIDLPAVIHRFATGFDELPLIRAGTPELRMMIGSAVLARAFVAQGLEVSPGVVQLIGIELDLG